MRHRLSRVGRLRCLLAHHRELIVHYRDQEDLAKAKAHGTCAALVLDQLALEQHRPGLR